MDNMNIWFLSAYEQPKGHTSRTYDYSQELLKRGHKVTLFCNSYFHRTHEELLEPDEKWRVEDVDGIRVIWLRTFHYSGNGWRRGFNMLSFAWCALKVAGCLEDVPDVVVGDSVPPTAGWAASTIARRSGAGFVFQVRDVWPIALVYDGGLSRWSPIYFAFRFLEKYLYRRANRICATMPFLHQHVRKSGGDPDKITCIPNGVNLVNYDSVEPYCGGSVQPLIAMYVGAFGFAHDVITIIRAASILDKNCNKGYRFIFVGDGVKKDECELEAKALGLTNVEFRKSVAKTDVPKLQEQADILIACVTDSKAYQFGLNLNKLYDYFASGRPVIFSGTSPNDPVAESGAGFSIPPENPRAMAEVLEKFLAMSPDERSRLGARARTYAETEFDVRILADRMETLLYEASGMVKQN